MSFEQRKLIYESYFKLCDAQNCSKNELELSAFKSPRTTKSSFFEILKKSQFLYQYTVNDQLLNLYLDCMNMIGSISAILSF